MTIRISVCDPNHKVKADFIRRIERDDLSLSFYHHDIESLEQHCLSNQTNIIIIDPLSYTDEKRVLQIIQALISSKPQIGVLIKVEALNAARIKLLYKIGVHGLLSSKANSEEWKSALTLSHQRLTYISPEIALHLAQYHLSMKQDAYRHPYLLLNDREFLIFIGIASGFTQNELCDQLSISRKTLTKHLNKCREKLLIKRLDEFIELATEFELLHSYTQ